MPTLHWLNDEEARRASRDVPYRLLEEDPELSYGDPQSQNMLIQGDNLAALKSLLPYYAGRVKCIYIDPPFNTEQALENYDDNLEHSIWLSLIYPRLEIIKELLAEDGLLFIHIDDNQIAYITVILDELFGRSNRASIITFKQGAPTGHKAINPGVVTITNYVLLYAKNKSSWKPNRLFIGRDRDARYNQFIINIEDDYSTWKTIPLSKAFCQSFGKTQKELIVEWGKEEYEIQLTNFVLGNANRVIRPARPDYQGVGVAVREVIDLSKQDKSKVYVLNRAEYSTMFFYGGERWLFYKEKLKVIDGEITSGEPLTNLWDDLLSNNLHNEGGVRFPKGKKPEALIKRILELSTNRGDLILDSFLGSGTTAAVAHKMDRRYIGIEMGKHAITHCVPRLKRVVDGEQGGISKAVNWQGGGGFRFYRLGEPVFDENNRINPHVTYPALAAHCWFSETKTPFPIARGEEKTPLLGVHNGTAYYLLFNGILGDKTPEGGNVLTQKLLRILPPFAGPKVIYGEVSLLDEARLRAEGITFKKIPYELSVR